LLQPLLVFLRGDGVMELSLLPLLVLQRGDGDTELSLQPMLVFLRGDGDGVTELYPAYLQLGVGSHPITYHPFGNLGSALV
jgi:hypothetical protein